MSFARFFVVLAVLVSSSVLLSACPVLTRGSHASGAAETDGE